MHVQHACPYIILHFLLRVSRLAPGIEVLGRRDLVMYVDDALAHVSVETVA